MEERKANLRHLIRVEDYLLDGRKECKTKISKENNIPIEVIGYVLKYLINRGFMETTYKHCVTLYYLNENYINKIKEVRNEKENSM